MEEEYRGRILSTLFLNRGLVLLGTMSAGFGLGIWGVEGTLGTMAAALVILASRVLRFARLARDLD